MPILAIKDGLLQLIRIILLHGCGDIPVFQHLVLPNAGLFSFLVTWGECAVGVGVLLGLLTAVAAGFGMLMRVRSQFHYK